MTSLRLLLALSGFVASLSFAHAQNPETGLLIVALTGFESEKGDVLIQLANSKEDYDADEQGFRVARVKAVGGKASHRFAELPYGEYALKIFHDENSNQELDIGWLGPEERYGFSNGARGTMGPPDWEEAKFTFDQPEQTVAIEVK